jgi:hypothetical protein
MVISMLMLLAIVQAGGDPAMTKEQAVEQAKQAVAARTQLPEAELTLKVATAAEWPNGGLGCPEPGKMYAQVITPGYRVAIEANGRVYDVHVGPSRAAVCGERFAGPASRQAQGRLGEPLRPDEKPIEDPSSPEAKDRVARAKEDLAKRLSIAADTIQLLKYESVTWPDGSLGCAQPGVVYLQVPTDGARIRLAAQDRAWVYHAGRAKQLVLCDQGVRR